MRGERASLGKSLEDAERDMRIKARIITAIEDSDISGFPNQSVIAGYVRSYARYLGMDADLTFRRFCAESGYTSPSLQSSSALNAQPGRFGSRVRNASAGPLATDPLGRSRFAPVAASTGLRPRISLGALTSACALVGLIAALSYGGYALLQDIQRVGFAPLPQAPNVVVDAPSIGTPEIDTAALPRPAAEDYAGGGALAEVVLPAELAATGRAGRDGPISAIDPADAGLFTNPEPEPVELTEAFDPADDPTARDVSPLITAEINLADVPQGVVLRASEDAWIRVRDDDNAVVFEGILVAGDSFDVPERVAAPRLRAGNAGGIYVVVDGIAYGPVGERGRVASNVSLRAEDIRTNMPQAEPDVLQPEHAAGTQRRADAAPLARQ
ncbi:MAG: RodZ domain-containing protein [Pseudomonadota bacterium]